MCEWYYCPITTSLQYYGSNRTVVLFDPSTQNVVSIYCMQLLYAYTYERI